MKSSYLRILGFFLLLIIILPIFIHHPVVHAQDKVCTWRLVKEEPNTRVAPTVPTATASLDGASVEVYWEGLTLIGSWTAPGAILTPGEELLFEVSTSWSLDPDSDLNLVGGVNTYINFNWSGTTVRAQRDSIIFQTEPQGFIVNSLYWKVPTGSTEGAEYTILATMDAAVAGGSIRYTYSYVCEEITPTPTKTQPATNTPTITKTIVLKDSGATITAINGEVQVFFPTGVDDQGRFTYDDYVFAREKMKLPVGTIIYAVSEDEQPGSFAIIQFMDLSTFVVKSNTRIRLDPGPEQSSNWELLYGKIKTNIQRMMQGESLEVRTERSVTGVEGTTFVLEEDGIQTILKVIEGIVKFTSLADGSVLEVFTGQMVSADDSGLSPVTTFDIEAELATWPDNETLDNLSAMGGSLESWLKVWIPDFLKDPPLVIVIVLLLLGMAGIALLVILAVTLLVKKKKASNLPGEKKSSLALPIVLMIGLLLFTCLMLSSGGVGLYLKLRQSAPENEVSTIDQTLAALSQTEAILAEQRTRNAEGPVVSPTANPSPPPEPTQTILPTDTVTSETTDLPTEIQQPTTLGPPLTGAQSITDRSIFDDFSSDALGWPVKDESLTLLRVENGTYRFQLREKEGFDYAYLPVDFNPKEISFDVQGPENANEGTFGVICQLQDADNYYFVEFDLLNGEYTIVQVSDGQRIPLTAQNAVGQYWHPIYSFKQPPTSINRISIGCYLGDISLSVNDEIVDIVFIGQPFPQPGLSAFFLTTYDYVGDEGYQVIIDNVEAYEPVQ